MGRWPGEILKEQPASKKEREEKMALADVEKQI